MKIYIASANTHKIKEAASILAPFGIDLHTHPAYGTIEPEETGSTFAENASIKADALSALSDNYVIADDSGICVDALNGAPGIYSARYAGKHGDDSENNRLLLKNMKDISNRAARFVCAIALSKSGKTEAVFEGYLEGSVALQESGRSGFGYDPLLLLENNKTVAELSAEEKNKISHRSQALIKLGEYIKAKYGE